MIRKSVRWTGFGVIAGMAGGFIMAAADIAIANPYSGSAFAAAFVIGFGGFLAFIGGMIVWDEKTAAGGQRP